MNQRPKPQLANMPKRALAGLIAAFAIAPAGCTAGFGQAPGASSIRVQVVQGDVGTATKRLPITFTDATRFTVRIEALGADGKPDGKFSGFVRLSTKPGTIFQMAGGGVRGRNVQLSGGVAEGVVVDLVATYGDSRIWAEDVGYAPSGADKPRCSDGVDNDNDGLVDFPTDPGCAFADDDTENPGGFATGASETLFFQYPRIADVRGVGQGGAATPFPKEQVQIDTGYDRGENKFNHSLVVTRIASDGFYVTDIDDPRGYTSIFAYTFNPPARLGVCDRLVTLSGTAVDFFGFTELSFPAWSVEERVCKKNGDALECNRPCFVPEPRVLALTDLANLKEKLRASASLVRVESKGDVEVRIAQHFGKGDAPKDGGQYSFTNEASNCDFNRNGRVEFDRPDEAECSNACDKDPECVEWSAFAQRSDFELVIEEKRAAQGSRSVKVQANATAAPDFDVLAARGKPLRAYSGTLRYFSGGSQFTIEARCQDDVVADMGASPKASDQACVFPRLDTDNNAGTQ